MQGIPMIIECDACRARFRLDRKLLQGYMGVRFRCRRCGGPIIVKTPEPPIARDPASPRHRHDPKGPSTPLSAPPAPPRADRQSAVRTSPSAASAQPLFKEESVAEAKPGNLVDLQSPQGDDRGRMPVSADNISRNITCETPYPELPFLTAEPEVHATKAPVQPIPELPIPAAEAPAHRIPEEPPVPRGRATLETLFPREAEKAEVVLPDALEKPPSPPEPRRGVRRRHMSVEPSSPVVMIFVAAIGTAMGCLGLYFLILGLTFALRGCEIGQPRGPAKPPGRLSRMDAGERRQHLPEHHRRDSIPRAAVPDRRTGGRRNRGSRPANPRTADPRGGGSCASHPGRTSGAPRTGDSGNSFPLEGREGRSRSPG